MASGKRQSSIFGNRKKRLAKFWLASPLALEQRESEKKASCASCVTKDSHRRHKEGEEEQGARGGFTSAGFLCMTKFLFSTRKAQHPHNSLILNIIYSRRPYAKRRVRRRRFHNRGALPLQPIRYANERTQPNAAGSAANGSTC